MADEENKQPEPGTDVTPAEGADTSAPAPEEQKAPEGDTGAQEAADTAAEAAPAE